MLLSAASHNARALIQLKSTKQQPSLRHCRRSIMHLTACLSPPKSNGMFFRCSPSWFTHPVRALIDRLLVPEPTKRISLSDIEADPW